MHERYNLDVETPENVPIVLETVANYYRESQGELSASWQDENAGKVWGDFANILERAARSCRLAISKRLPS